MKPTQVRHSPLLIFLLILILGARASVADELLVSDASTNEASTIPLGTVISTGPVESTVGGPAAEQSSTAAGAFDISYLIVLSLGIGGLIWIRRQSQSL